eukprot:387011_1
MAAPNTSEKHWYRCTSPNGCVCLALISLVTIIISFMFVFSEDTGSLIRFRSISDRINSSHINQENAFPQAMDYQNKEMKRKLQMDYQNQLDHSSPFNTALFNVYFSKLLNKTTTSTISNNITLLNIYELHHDERLEKLHLMWPVAIYDTHNDIYWQISRSLERNVKWVLSAYRHNNFKDKVTNDQLFSSPNGAYNLAEPRLFLLNRDTILAVTHNGGALAVVNFTQLIIEPTKTNNFSTIESSNAAAFKNCILRNDKENHKNWSPLVMNGSLYFVIQHEPFTLIHCEDICDTYCTTVYQESLPKSVYTTFHTTLRGGSQYICLSSLTMDGAYDDIYVGFLHSHIRTKLSPHKAIYRGHLSVINVKDLKVLYISGPIIWNWNQTSQYELKWQESSPSGIIRWTVDPFTYDDVMYLSWCIGGIQNGGEYRRIITKQAGFYKFVVNGLKYGFNEYVRHPYWEER